jgi:hypothetical protein
LWITWRICAPSAQTGGSPRQRLRQTAGDRHARILVERQHLAHEPVQIERRRLGRRQARVVPEVVDHLLQRGHLVDDGLGGALERVRILARQALRELHLQPLCRELDRRERVLDLVSEAPRDLGPSRGALRLR